MSEVGNMLRTIITYLFTIILLTCCSPSKKKDIDNKDYDEYEIADPSQTGPEKESKVHIIEIKQMKFEPEVLNVKKGDKIVWMNKDIVEHDVTEQSKEWASSKLPTGVSWSMVVTKSEVYYCNLHVVMKGKVVVDGADISMLDFSSGITMCK